MLTSPEQRSQGNLDNFTAVGLAEGFVDGSEDEVIAAWQHLVNTGLAWQLQGWFGRTAASLIESGVIAGPGGAQ